MGSDFNREMETYLKRKAANKPRIEIDEDTTEIYGEKPWYQEVVRIFKGPKDKTVIVEEEIGEEEFQEEEKMGIIAKIVNSVFPQKDFEEEFDEDIVDYEPDIAEDIKEVLKIQNRWLKKLSKEKLAEFKNSEDFTLYKQVLEKYNLIK